MLAAHDHAIDDRVHVGDFRLVEGELLREVDAFAVYDQLAAALLADLGEDEVQLLAVQLEHGRAELDFGAFGQRQNRFENLIRRAAGDALAGARAVRFGDGGEQQVQVAGDVGHGSDCRTRIAAGSLLFDRDHRRETVHEVDVGLGHLRDKALGVGGERLHVPALPFGVDGVEGEARFARTRETGDYDQPVARQFERYVFEVVNARALHRDGGARGGPGVLLSRGPA